MRHSVTYDTLDLNRFFQEMATGEPVPGSPYRVSIAHHFQKDFSDFISDGIGRDHDFFADIGGLNVYVLRGNMELAHHGPSECVVLEDKNSGAYVVLLGERIKRNLFYLGGILGFFTKGEKPVEEVRHIFSLWTDAIAPLKAKTGDDWHAQMAAARELFQKTEFNPAADKYLAPFFGPKAIERFRPRKSPAPGTEPA